MKFHCDRCKTRYSISDERVRGKILKIRCKNCSGTITVREGMPTAEAGRVGKAESKPGAGAVPRQKPSESGQRREPGRTPSTSGPSLQAANLRGAFDAAIQAGSKAPPPPSTVSEEWYVAAGGVQSGPFNTARAQQWIREQKDPSELYCWSDGMDDWRPVSELTAFRVVVDAMTEAASLSEEGTAVAAVPPEMTEPKARPLSERSKTVADAPPQMFPPPKPRPPERPRAGAPEMSASSSGLAPISPSPSQSSPMPAPGGFPGGAAAGLGPGAPGGLGQAPSRHASVPLTSPVNPARPATPDSHVSAPLGPPSAVNGPNGHSAGNGAPPAPQLAVAPTVSPRGKGGDVDLHFDEVSRIVRLPLPPDGLGEVEDGFGRGSGTHGAIRGRRTSLPPFDGPAVQPPKRRSGVLLPIALATLVIGGLVGLLIYLAVQGPQDNDRVVRADAPDTDLGVQIFDPARERAPTPDVATETTEGSDTSGSRTGTSGRNSSRQSGTKSVKSGGGKRSGDIDLLDLPDDGTGRDGVVSDGQVLDAVTAMARKQNILFTRCHERALKRDPLLEATKATATISVNAEGRVGKVSIPALGRSDLGTCLKRTIKRWRLPKSKSGVTTRLTIILGGR